MKCKTQFDLFIFPQESFKSPVFNFKTADISNDEFIYRIRKQYSADFTEYPTARINEHEVYIEKFTLPDGNYLHELIWIHGDQSDLVFQGKLTIDYKGSTCIKQPATKDIIIEMVDNTIVVEYSERIINEGPKGDPFTYDDFTPEQLENLKRPATEAADNANTATQNAITATNEANTATVSANQSAQTANESATNADNSADLANTAAANANDAATAANNAAEFANSQRGWTPIHVFESDGAQRQVKILTDYIGGTGDKPTENIGLYVVDNGYTDDKSLATNFKGDQNDNLLFEYIHTSNKEVNVSSVDYEANTFTSVAHGMSTNQRFFATIKSTEPEFPTNIMPGGIVTREYYIVNITANTFQVSLTSSGAPVILTVNPTVDLLKWHFEQANNFPGVGNFGNFKDITICIAARVSQNGRLGVYSGGFDSTIAGYTISPTFIGNSRLNCMVRISQNENWQSITRIGNYVGLNETNKTYVITPYQKTVTSFKNRQSISAIGFHEFFVFNGSSYRVYKL